MDLDTKVARWVAWGRVVEMTVHGSDPWTFRTMGGITTAHRLVDCVREEIVFTGLVMPTSCGIVELWCGEELVTVITADVTQGSKITWKIQISSPVPS